LRVGILGGVFNPPHIGHIVCACEALDRLGLDAVRLVPVRRAPHRAIELDPGAQTRLEMCERAVQGHDGLEVSRVELDREGPSYTVDTLRSMHDAEPEDDLVLILGGDQAVALGSWREPAEVVRLATLAVAERGDLGRAQVQQALAGFGDADQALFFDMPPIGVSSTMVRGRVAEGRAFRHLVPPGVGDLIGGRELYAAPVAEARG
jgi:nicotinate-nucleotide adenylyltransferase